MHETIPGLYRGPPQDEGWDEDEQAKNMESKNVTKNLRGRKKETNESTFIKIKYIMM